MTGNEATTRRAAPAGDELAGAFVFAATVIGVIVGLWIGDTRWPEVYYRLVAEDGPVEWATFWGLVLGAVANAVLTARIARRSLAKAWYAAGVASFCLLVAGEEISWGQRLFGYQPPDYFLRNNVQLEANIHNLMPPAVWSFGIEAILCGFGIVAPLVLLARKPAQLAERIGFYAAPPRWMPAWAAVLALYVFHPFHLCEEIVEAQLGFGLAAAALWRCMEQPSATTGPRRRPLALAASAVLVCVLGVAASMRSEESSASDDARVAQARAELEALREDLVAMRRENGGKFVTECNLHVRVHSVDSGIRSKPLHEGAFSRVAGAASQARARYFLDPWDTPYWLSDQCDSGARYILLYSFGPNRKRDSTHWEVGGDDVGAYAFHLGTPRTEDWRSLAFPERP